LVDQRAMLLLSRCHNVLLPYITLCLHDHIVYVIVHNM
jgi:hypothetical protein